MPRCDYCGRENERIAQFCSGCGTELPVAVEEPENQDASANVLPPPLPDVPRLNSWSAIKILLIYLGAQFLVGLLVAMLAGAAAAMEGKHLENQDDRLELTKSIRAPAVALSFLFGGLAGIGASFGFVSAQLKDRTPTGAAWVLGPVRDVSQALLLGVLAAFTYFFLSAIALSLGVPKPTVDLFTSMASTPGLSRILLVVSALLAPVFEELLFRGVLYGGLRRSFGSAKAAFFTTGVFTLLHIGEWSHFLPAMIGVAGMASLALWLRLRSGAIGPAIAAHFGYNATLMIALLLYISHVAPK